MAGSAAGMSAAAVGEGGLDGKVAEWKSSALGAATSPVDLDAFTVGWPWPCTALYVLG